MQVDVERNHASLDVDVLDDHLLRAVAIAVADFQLAGRELFDLSNQLVVKAVARKAHFAVFQRIGHAAHAVVLLDQQILALDLLARSVFGRRIKVLNHLENIRKTGQIKHQHHHALDAGGDAKFVGRMAQVVQKVAVKQRLALFGQAQRVVNFVARLARHHAAQKLHIGRWHFHVHHEVGAGKAEQHQQIVLAKQGGVYDQAPFFVVQNRQRKRKLIKAVDQLAHHIAALVAKKQAREHLNLKVRAQLGVTQTLLHGTRHPSRVARQVFKAQAQVKVFHHARQHLGHRAQRRVIRAVGGARLGVGVFDVLGAYRRTHKNKVVLKISAVQDFGGDRVEKSLGQLGLVVVYQQADVVQLDLLPHIHGLHVGLVFTLQTVRAFQHPQVIKLDALALRALLAVPVGRLKTVLGAG